MSEAIEVLNAQQFGVLVQLREQLWSGLKIAAHGHEIEPAHPDALDVGGDLVWAELRHRRERDEDDGYTHAIALMPVAVLQRPEEAQMRLRVWLELMRLRFDPARDPESLRHVALARLEVHTIAKTKRFTSELALREAYGAAPHFGSWMPLPELRTEAGESAVDVVERVMADLQHLGGGLVELRAVSASRTEDRWICESRPGSGIFVTFQLIISDEYEGQRAIRDIKEQWVLTLPAQAFYQVDRIEPYLRGWGAAVDTVLRDVRVDVVEGLMPCDLVFPQALTLARPRTAEDFRDAMLVSSRLGKLQTS